MVVYPIFLFFFLFFFVFFFNDTATTEIYTLSLHDALPICRTGRARPGRPRLRARWWDRSEEHTSELQSHVNLVCRLLLEKKKKKRNKERPNQKQDTKNQERKTK